MPEYVWIYLNMPEYARICLNMSTFTGNGMIVLQTLENSQESNDGEVLFWYSYRPFNFIKTGPHHGCFLEKFLKFLEQMIWGVG